MEYNDFPDLKENIIEKMAMEYRDKVHNIKVLETEPSFEENNDEFFSKLSEGIQLGISFLEILLRFSKTIFKIRRVKEQITSALESEKKEFSSLKLNSIQASAQIPHWGGFFRKNCETFLSSEFILLYLLLNELRRPRPALSQEKIVDMANNHINNIKLVSSLLI